MGKIAKAIDYWQHLQSAIPSWQGCRILSDTDLNRQSGEYDLIVTEDALCNIYDHSQHFAMAKALLAENGIYVMAERVTGEEDAWLNTLMASIERNHVRCLRVNELINAAAEHLSLIEFLRQEAVFTYDVPTESAELVEKQLAEFPKSLLELTEPEYSNGKLRIKQSVGLFVWRGL